jgi:hypothetical protein
LYIGIRTLSVEISTDPIPIGLSKADSLRWFLQNRDVVTLYEGEELIIPRRYVHRASAYGMCGPGVFLEVAYGHNDEEDIVRLLDDYGRA